MTLAPSPEALRDALRSMSDRHANELLYARPKLPDELDDRAQDVWEPLLAIADLAGEEWDERARATAMVLSSDAEREDDTASVQLLRDIYAVFEQTDAGTFKTADLLAELADIEESPWGDWYGKTITPQALGKLLKPYRIRTMPVWVDGQTVKGYKVEQFADAWLRVLGVRRVRGVRSGSSSHAAPNPPDPPNPQNTNGRYCDDCTTPKTCADEHTCLAIRELAKDRAGFEELF